MKRYLLPSLSLVLALGLLATATEARTPPSLPPPTKNVYETMEGQKNLSKFTAMVDEAGLKSLLTGSTDQPVTVFAPNNEAMESLTSEQEKKISGSKANLQSFVKYHVISGSLMSSSAFKGRKTSPASDNGEILTLDGANRSEAPKVGDGKLVQGDVNATNGVVHIVSTALLPPSMGGASNMSSIKMPDMPVPPVPPSKTAVSVTTTGKNGTKSLHDVTTAGTPESVAPPSASGATPLGQTATGLPLSKTTTGSVPEVTPEQPAQQPVPAPVGH